MSRRSLLRWMVWREWRDQRSNRMLWPVLLLMPLVGAAVPALMSVLAAETLANQALLQRLGGPLVGWMRMMAAAGGLDLIEIAGTVLLRMSAGYFLLMPLAIVSITAAYSVVGEKVQRTLEPVLATPLTTRDFLLGKLLAVTLPAVLVTWLSALVGTIATLVAFQLRHGRLLLPDGYFLTGVLVLGPEIAAITALVCLRVSARMQDPQAANQVTGLLLAPALLLLFALIGPILVADPRALAAAVVGFGIVAWLLLRWVAAGFGRDQIIGRV